MRLIKRFMILSLSILISSVLAGGPAVGADKSKVDRATRQVEEGAKKIGGGDVGQGAEETAKGIGNTVVEGAKFSGEKLKEAGRTAEPGAKSAWQSTKDGATAFGRSVKNFFDNLFR
jgi:hypothetical protein